MLSREVHLAVVRGRRLRPPVPQRLPLRPPSPPEYDENSARSVSHLRSGVRASRTGEAVGAFQTQRITPANLEENDKPGSIDTQLVRPGPSSLLAKRPAPHVRAPSAATWPAESPCGAVPSDSVRRTALYSKGLGRLATTTAGPTKAPSSDDRSTHRRPRDHQGAAAGRRRHTCRRFRPDGLGGRSPMDDPSSRSRSASTAALYTARVTAASAAA